MFGAREGVVCRVLADSGTRVDAWVGAAAATAPARRCLALWAGVLRGGVRSGEAIDTSGTAAYPGHGGAVDGDGAGLATHPQLIRADD